MKKFPVCYNIIIIHLFICTNINSASVLCYCKNYHRCNENGTIKSPTNYCRIIYPSNVNKFQTILRDHPYSSETPHDCPEIYGLCQNHSLKISCCCIGNFCNKDLKSVTVIPPKMVKIAEEMTTVMLPKLDVSINYEPMSIILSIIVILLCLTFLIIWFLSKKNNIIKSAVTMMNRRFSQEATKVSLLNALFKDEKGVNFDFGELISSQSKKLESISEGRSSMIWLVNISNKNGHTCKSIAKIFAKSQKSFFLKELNIYHLKGLRHQNISKFLGSFEYAGEEGSELWLVLEYHSLGSVFDFLSAGNALSKLQLHRIVSGIADGLDFLHDNLPHLGKPALAHRDIKPHNILLDSAFVPKYTDFELTIDFSAIESFDNVHYQVGTRRYMAPELLESYVALSCRAFQCIDVYAMALVIWELMNRSYWDDRSRLTILEEKYRLAFEQELGRDPPIEKLKNWVGIQQKRPEPNIHWLTDRYLSYLWWSVEELWDQDADARITASCFVNRLKVFELNKEEEFDIKFEERP